MDLTLGQALTIVGEGVGAVAFTLYLFFRGFKTWKFWYFIGGAAVLVATGDLIALAVGVTIVLGKMILPIAAGIAAFVLIISGLLRLRHRRRQRAAGHGGGGGPAHGPGGP